MNSKIVSLANLIQEKKKSNQTFTLMLGAGASFGSGVKTTDKLMEELVQNFGSHIQGDTLRQRFDKLWAETPEETRALHLQPYLDQTPSPGYQRLAELIAEGYFNLVLTFNFDHLVETALQQHAGLQTPEDFITIIRGDHLDDKIVSMARTNQVRVKVLKLHGSLRGGNTFLFTRAEMVTYPDSINDLVKQLTRQDLIVCGYGLEDTCMMRAFSPDGGAIYCVNPSGPPANLDGYMNVRKSAGNVIDKDDGKFDNFFQQLHEALHPPDPVEPKSGPTLNPFKFLDSYNTEDQKLFFGRKSLTRRILQTLDRPPNEPIHIVGKSKAGKTSLLRAGLMAYLDRKIYDPVYIRCTPDLEASLPLRLKEQFRVPSAGDDLPAVMSDLAASKRDRCVVLILDQFERVTRGFPDSGAGRKSLVSLLSALRTGGETLKVISAAASDPQDSLYLMCLLEQKAQTITVPNFEERRVGKLIGILGRRTGRPFDPDVIQVLIKEYGRSMASSNPFSLAHIHTICSVLFTKPRRDRAAYEQILKDYRESLDKAINQYDVLNFVADCPSEEQRMLIRSIIRTVAQPCKEKIAEFLQDHFSQAPLPALSQSMPRNLE